MGRGGVTDPSEAPGGLRARAAALVAELGLARAGEVGEVRALAGGVASDIAAVELPGGAVCVKFALPKLRVAADWRAPVHRSRAEYAWLGAAGAVVPGQVPRLLGWSDGLLGFAMEMVAGPGVSLWKADLLAGGPAGPLAPLVGDLLGRVHAASARPGFDRAPFRNHDDLWALRLEPYLLHAALAHPGVAGRLRALAEAHHRADTVLVHGDVSPKNVLVRDGAPVLLDAECASLGDASFDLAFCLNHLVLKAVHAPALAGERLRAARALWAAYRCYVAWEDAEALGARVAALLPALMLARVDGKSPVEYLSEAARGRVRLLALPLVADPPVSLPLLLDHLEART